LKTTNTDSKPEVDLTPEERLEPFEDGFNRRTVLAAVFVGLIMLPGSIYLSLVMGVAPGGAAQWVTVILFLEVARRSFIVLRRQEILLIYLVAGSMIAPGVIMGAAGLTLSGGAFAEPIWRQFLVRSPQAGAFGLTDKIPRWIVPPAGADSLIRRSFLSRDWLVPIAVLLVHQLLFRVNFLSLGYALYRITNDIEGLRFPMAPVAAEGATALADASSKQETWRWRLFGTGAMIGLAYGLVYVAVPTFTGIVLTKPLQLIPIPYVDFTPEVGSFCSAMMLGFMTDLGLVFVGFVLPFRVVVGMFAGSIVAKVILPPFLVRWGLVTTWREGMEARPTDLSLNVDMYISTSIGLGVVVALLGIWGVIKALRKGRREDVGTARAQRIRLEGRGELALWKAFAIWAASSAVYVILCHVLVPEFPLWILMVFGFVLSPLLSYMSARMFGITGSPKGVAFPMVREGSFILSGYKGVDIWFAPIPYFNQGRGAQTFKMLELARTKFVGFIKMQAVVFLVMLFTSFLFWSLIWRMGPIPSAMYPFVQKMWPFFAKYKALWATSTLGEGRCWLVEAITLPKVAGGFAIGWAVYAATAAVGWSGAFYGAVGGMALWPHYTVPLLIGSLLGRFYFARKLGADTWRRYTPVLTAGYYCGIGLIGMAAAAFALIGKAVTPLVF